MTKPIARDPIYRRRRFEGETIDTARSLVWHYLGSADPSHCSPS
jgi:hypothetical protein